jgi:hypothetical protein
MGRGWREHGGCFAERMRQTTLVSLSLAAVAACTNVGPVDIAVDPAESLSACLPYPVEWLPTPGAQMRAQQQLDELATQAGSTPTMVWSQPRGTSTGIFGLNYPLAGCPGISIGADSLIDPRVEDAAFALFQSAPALFQLRRDEWQVLNSTRCSEITDQQAQTIALQRTTLAGQTERQDIVLIIAMRIGGAVKLTSLMADYLPPATKPIDATMHSCPELTPPTAEFIARDAEYSYSIFDSCFPAGSGVYVPRANDTFALDTKNQWKWEDAPAGDRTLLRKYQTGILTVHPDNWTPELINSDAFCGTSIGWVITFNAVTGEIVETKPGIDCIVC